MVVAAIAVALGPGKQTCWSWRRGSGFPSPCLITPPGTSKWNRIEHRLFSFISLTWKGQPLWNLETVINLIGATRTRTGLRVKAVLDTPRYETGVKISDEQIDTQRIRRSQFHPEWNYTILPQTAKLEASI